MLISSELRIPHPYKQFKHQAITLWKRRNVRHRTIQDSGHLFEVGTRGSFLESFGVDTKAAGFCSTAPSWASHRYSERTDASARAAEVLLSPWSYR